jgi:hypothetical protein
MKRILVIIAETLAYLFPPLVGPRPYNGPEAPYIGPCPPL